MQPELLVEPMVQYGFAGLSVLLLGLLAWMVQKLVALLEANTRVISENTNAIAVQNAQQREAMRLFSDIRDRLLRRPCLRGED
jgi:hypothetical protein